MKLIGCKYTCNFLVAQIFLIIFLNLFKKFFLIEKTLDYRVDNQAFVFYKLLNYFCDKLAKSSSK
jgi:hypothetical protein